MHVPTVVDLHLCTLSILPVRFLDLCEHQYQYADTDFYFFIKPVCYIKSGNSLKKKAGYVKEKEKTS